MGGFSNVLKNLRQSKKLTQEEFAEKIGMSQSAVTMYETGKREPDFETLELIADFFNVTMDYLLGKTKPSDLYVTDLQLKFALFGNPEIDDEVLDDVKKLAILQMKLREEKKRTDKK